MKSSFLYLIVKMFIMQFGTISLIIYKSIIGYNYNRFISNTFDVKTYFSNSTKDAKLSI
ncbi:hypothetical protein BD770DRAFT_385827 [Pilaira anomala]|nr:hypothetical protein BD770DRAFT_385827 [Pilaira anomala]